MKTVNIEKSQSWQMFNEISPRYDFLNRVLSFGLDVHWRKCLAKFLPQRPGLKVLDLATGTADVLLSLFQYDSNVAQGVGCDMAEKMMGIGREKIAAKGLSDRICLESGDAHRIVYPAQTFDAVTISFGIRNMSDYKRVLNEMCRVLKPGGRGIILEFSMPANPVIRFFHVAYLRLGVPAIGWVLTGHYKAYKYLNQTIEEFPYGEAFCSSMRDAGFSEVKAHPLLLGAATIYVGGKS